LKILFIADVVRKSGVEAVRILLPKLVTQHLIDLVIANGENIDGGGLTPDTAETLLKSGVNVITTGNHTWQPRYSQELLSKRPLVLRPINLPGSSLEDGYAILNVPGLRSKVAIINLLGKINMGNEYIDNPFTAISHLLTSIGEQIKVIIIDFHAQYTYEKRLMGHYLDGRVSALLGTHTHVGTIDARILPKGTAYITDIGMVGASNSVIGVAVEPVIERFLTQMPTTFRDAEGPVTFNSVVIDVDEESGKATDIFRVDDTVSF